MCVCSSVRHDRPTYAHRRSVDIAIYISLLGVGCDTLYNGHNIDRHFSKHASNNAKSFPNHRLCIVCSCVIYFVGCSMFVYPCLRVYVLFSYRALYSFCESSAVVFVTRLKADPDLPLNSPPKYVLGLRGELT